MEKILLTSKKFEGEVVLGYEGSFLVYFFNSAVMTPEQVKYLFRYLPWTRDMLDSFVAVTNMRTRIVPPATEFADFWEAYAKKVNRKRCEPLWAKLSDNKRLACLMSLEPYDNYLRRNNGRAKLDPENYLKRYAWENDWNAL